MSGVRISDMIHEGDSLDAVLALIVRARNDPSLNLGVADDAVQAARVEWARASAVYRAAILVPRKECAA